MTTALPDAQLDQIVDLVAHGNVVPIVGDELLAIETPGGPRPVSHVVAERLAASLALSPMPGATLSDVAAAYLATGPRARMQRVRAELAAIIKADAAAWQPAAALCDLATIDAFTLFISTGLDPLLEIALRFARGAERPSRHSRSIRRRKTCPPAGGAPRLPYTTCLAAPAARARTLS